MGLIYDRIHLGHGNSPADPPQNDFIAKPLFSGPIFDPQKGRDPGSGQIWPGPDSARPRQNCGGRKSPSSGQNLLDPGISGRFSTHVFLRGSNEGQNPGLGHGVGKIWAASTTCSTWAKLRGSHQNLPGEISPRPPSPLSPPTTPQVLPSPSKSFQVPKSSKSTNLELFPLSISLLTNLPSATLIFLVKQCH